MLNTETNQLSGGYEKDRFVELSDTDSDELSCFICQNILRDPVVAKCCQMVFCRQCIQQWIQKKTTCPFSRTPLTIEQLVLPSVIIQNRLKKLKIVCDNQEKGCREVISLGNFSRHLISCPFKGADCLECPKSQCVRQLEQKCIRPLDKEFRSMKLLLERLKDSNEYTFPVIIATNMAPDKAEQVADCIARYAREGRNMQTQGDRISRATNRYYSFDLEEGSRGRWRCSCFALKSTDRTLTSNQWWASVRYFHVLFNVYCRHINPIADVDPRLHP